MIVNSGDLLFSLQPDFALWQSFAESTDVIFWAADPVTFQLVYVSPHAEDALGVPLTEWLRPSFWQAYLHTSDQKRVLARFATAVSSQKAVSFEYRLITANGYQLWFRNRVCLLEHKQNALLCGLMTNVTEFKTAVHHQTSTPGYTSIFLEIVTLLSSNLDIKQCLLQLAEKLAGVFDVTAVSIHEWNPDWSMATQLAYYNGLSDAAPPEDRGSRKLLSNIIENLENQKDRNPILFSIEDANLSETARTHLQNHKAQSILYVPLTAQAKLIGCIELIESRAPRHFSQNDQELSQIIAQQTAIAMARAQLFEAEARRRREAEFLLEVAEFVSSSLDRDEILTRVMEILRVYLDDVHNCSISLITNDGLTLETIISWWADDAYALMPKGTRLLVDATFTSQLAIKGGEPVIISDLKEIPFSNDFTSAMIKNGLRAILCVPLKIHNRPLGILQVHHWHEPRQFLAQEVALLQGAANQAAIAIENARLFANERRQLHLSRTLQKVGALLTTSLQLEQVYEQIFNLLGEVIAFDSASLFLFDKTNEQFVMVAARGFEVGVFDNGQLNLPATSVARKINKSPGWAVIKNVLKHSGWISRLETQMIRAWIGALLLIKDEQIGLLCVDSVNRGQYSDADGQTVAAFANQAAVAIENARLYEETMRQAKELTVLNQVAQETAVSLNIDAFLEKVTQTIVAELYPYQFGFIMFDAKTKRLWAHPSYHGVSEESKQTDIPLQASIIGHVVLSSKPYFAANVQEDPYYNPTTTEIRSEIAVPLKVNQEVIGAINVESPELDAFSDRDADFLTTLAANIAAVLERARLYETLRIQAASLAEQVAQRTSELKYEKDRLAAILESAGEGIILTDTEANILYANPALERQSGYSRDELWQKNPRILGSSQMPQSVFAEMWQSLQSQKGWVGQLVNRHKDGHDYDVAITVTPISDAEGNVTGYVSVQSDITRMKELERLKTEFIANVSHQLRTPLTNIKTYVSLLSKGKPEKFPRYFSVLHYEIDRLARLIQDLLDISRLDAEAAPKPEAATDFCDVWQLYWSPYMERAERANRHLQLSLPQAVVEMAPIVFMESYQLEKIFSRLMENALTYSNEGGKIWVSVDWQAQNPRVLEVKVCDDGPGISEEERPFIFDRFFRGSQAVEAGLPGNGLGLAIVKGLLMQHGGDIFVESEVGVGSCFILHLPLVLPNGNNGESDDRPI